MIHDSKKKRAIEKILKSKEFKNSQSSKNLLNYILEKHLANEIPTESIIAVEYFSKKATYNSSEDSTVRYQMYKLRQKLEHYYVKRGQEDEIVVSIPKGHYEMKFDKIEISESENNIKPQPSIKKLSRREKLYIILTCLSFLISIVFIILWQQSPQIQNPISKSDSIWSSFFDIDYPTNVVIGDIFIFEEEDINSKEFRRIMDYSITSQEEYLAYKAQYPERITRNILLNELPHNSISNIKDILHVFYSLNRTFDIKLSHNFKFIDLKKHNNIYIGEFTNLQILSDLLKIVPVYFDQSHDKEYFIKMFSDDMDTLQTFKTNSTRLYDQTEYNLDYGIIAKLPGLHGETNIVIAGFGYMSQIELVKMLSEKESIEILENHIKQYTPNIPDYFCVVFEVSGYELTGYSSELKLFKKIDENKYLESYRELLTKQNDTN